VLEKWYCSNGTFKYVATFYLTKPLEDPLNSVLQLFSLYILVDTHLNILQTN